MFSPPRFSDVQCSHPHSVHKKYKNRANRLHGCESRHGAGNGGLRGCDGCGVWGLFHTPGRELGMIPLLLGCTGITVSSLRRLPGAYASSGRAPLAPRRGVTAREYAWRDLLGLHTVSSLLRSARPGVPAPGRRGGHLKPRVVVDLGCGPGGLTASLLERWPWATVVRVDASEEMIRRAQRWRVAVRLFSSCNLLACRRSHRIDVSVSY
jgi:hypothetical protein